MADEDAKYELIEGPTVIEGRHEITFKIHEERIYRYMTDKQAAAFVSQTSGGKTRSSHLEIEAMTTPPDYKALEEQLKKER